MVPRGIARGIFDVGESPMLTEAGFQSATFSFPIVILQAMALLRTK